jgi:pyrroloquinoline quinone biosynthesis protein D
LSKLYRLQWEKSQDAFVLLYPEGMVKLNASAGEILSRVDGIKSVAVIISEIEEKFGLSNLSDDVVSFIGLAVEQGWVDLEGKKKDDS